MNKKGNSSTLLQGFGMCSFCKVDNRPMNQGEIVRGKKGRGFKCGECLKKDKKQ